jgi:hypothetical protein
MKWAGYVVNMEDIRSDLEIFVKKLRDIYVGIVLIEILNKQGKW